MIFMVLLSWHSHCESSRGSFDECRLSAEVAANRQIKCCPLYIGDLHSTKWWSDAELHAGRVDPRVGSGPVR